MARYDTTRRYSTSKPRCGGLKHSLFLLIGFLLGYTVATWLSWSQVVIWMNAHFLKNKSPEAVAPVKKYAEIPKPKFEFYTLLTQENASKSEPTASVHKESNTHVASTEPVSTQPSLVSEETVASVVQPNLGLQEQKAIEKTWAQAKTGYWVQLASFRHAQDAEKMKANLSLKGLMTTVVSVTQQGTQWFRVVLGPFADKLDAERAKKSVMLTVRIQAIVRKMDA